MWVAVDDVDLTQIHSYHMRCSYVIVVFCEEKSCLFRLFRYWSKTPKQTENFFWGGFVKQTKKQQKQIEFRFVLVQTEKNLLFRGHPNL